MLKDHTRSKRIYFVVNAVIHFYPLQMSSHNSNIYAGL